MGGGGGGGMEFHPVDGSSPLTQINLASPHHLDLVRLLTLKDQDLQAHLDNTTPLKGMHHWGDILPMKNIFRNNLGGRSFTEGELDPRAVFQDPDRNAITSLMGQSTNAYSSNFASVRHYGGLLSNTPIFKLEDRVRDVKTGVNHYFDILPEVKELQYRFALLPMIKLSNGDKEFVMHKNTLHKRAQEGPYRERFDPQEHETSTYRSQLLGSPQHTFYISVARIPDRGSQYQRQRLEPDVNPFEHLNKSLFEYTTKFKDESTSQHLDGLVSAYNSLWDKLDSGEYLRHPNFWSQHAFAAGKDRNSAWKEITGRLSSSDRYFGAQ